MIIAQQSGDFEAWRIWRTGQAAPRKTWCRSRRNIGPGTEKELKAYQEKERIAVDGIAGPEGFAHMGLLELILLKRGTKGDTVKQLQEKLEIDADGKFGSGTEKAVKAYQEANGLNVDGIAGPRTLAHMKLLGVSRISCRCLDIRDR